MANDGTSEIAAKHLRLHLADGVGPITFGRMIKYFGHIDRALGATAAELRCLERIGGRTAETIARSRDAAPVEQELALAAQHGIRVICRDDEDYPVGLRHIPDPPICLYVKGTLLKADPVALAVVGSRRATHYGHEQARRFGQLLGQVGLTVVSGLARGIDSAAHRGALDVDGRTIAVLGNGLADIYPPEHRPLADEIAAHGAVITELPMTTAPEAGNFPKRNRIIAGLGLGVLVIEGARNSGALITARLANEYNREVFALPGRVDLPNSSGPNTLIRNSHAKLITCLEDILDELGEAGAVLAGKEVKDATALPAARPAPANLSETEKQVLAVLTRDEAVAIDAVCQLAKLEPAQVASALTTLQLKGAVKQLPGSVFISLVQRESDD